MEGSGVGSAGCVVLPTNGTIQLCRLFTLAKPVQYSIHVENRFADFVVVPRRPPG